MPIKSAPVNAPIHRGRNGNAAKDSRSQYDRTGMTKNDPNPKLLLAIPNEKGAYVLVIVLDRQLTVEAGGRTGELRTGYYAYAGSAHGPGGLRARVARHLRRNKRLHWHVDQLTEAGRIEGIAFARRASECDLATRLADTVGNTVPLPGFGSSDCRDCQSHLIGLADKVSPVSVITEDRRLVYLAVPPAIR